MGRGGIAVDAVAHNEIRDSLAVFPVQRQYVFQNGLSVKTVWRLSGAIKGQARD